MEAKQERALKIALNSVKRLAKEQTVYEKEYQQAADKVANCGFEPGSSDYKRLEGIKQEAADMIEDNKHRLSDFKSRLQTVYNEVKDVDPSNALVIEAAQLLQ